MKTVTVRSRKNGAAIYVSGAKKAEVEDLFVGSDEHTSAAARGFVDAIRSLVSDGDTLKVDPSLVAGRSAACQVIRGSVACEKEYGVRVVYLR